MAHTIEHLCDVVEGWTGPLGPFTLRVDGAALALTGLTITLILRRQSGTLVSVGGTITVNPDQVNFKGQLTFTPVAGDFVWETNLHTITQTYKLHFKAVDGSGKIVYFPNAEPAEILVHRA